MKDYGMDLMNPFRQLQDLPKAGNRTPTSGAAWYGNLIIPLFLLDLFAIQMLFIPYLRTFLRIKTMTAWDRAVPQSLQAGTKIKLRNSMIYWDRDEHAIWLRPRGFNLILIPLTVAKLNVSNDDRSILGCEIRLSSGSLFLLALFLWTGYQVFSLGPTPKGVPPIVFVVMGAFALFAVWMNVRMLRSRMAKLLEDAAPDLDGMSASVPSPFA
jgi:hypothetical protein